MSTETKRFVVLEVNGIAQNLINLMEFVVDNNPTAGFKKLNKLAAINLLHKMAVMSVNWRLAHNPYGDYEAAIMEGVLGPRPSDYTTEEKQAYKELSTDPLWYGITDSIEAQISKHIEVDTYKDWKVVRVGTLIGMAEGQDYRITEYYRLNPEQREDDTAVISVDMTNPVNYLLGQFKQTFGSKMEQLLAAGPDYSQIIDYRSSNLGFNATLEQHHRHNEIRRHNSSMLVSNPADGYNSFLTVYTNPDAYIAAMLVDTLANMYPMVELAFSAPQFNTQVINMLGMWNVDQFRTEYVQRVISAFGLRYFSSYLKRDKRYVLEYSSNNVLSIYEKQKESPTEQEDRELVQSLIDGDRLNPEDARRAQSLYEEMSRRGII